MCGICGTFALDGQLDPAVRAALPEMTEAIRHRGPDGDGLFSDEHAALGHRRLAIIDRAGGDQPIANEDGSAWIVFNGEIYNHRALRAELTAAGHRYRTESDTETILHAYEQFGPDCVSRLEGMFAFAIYDQRRRELFIARDRLGKKPLFYGVLGGVLHFASEIKAFYPSPVWDDTVNLDNLEAYLSLGYCLAPDSIYRHVHKLEPAHWLLVRNGELRVHKYWDIEQFDGDRRGADALLPDLDARLTAAVGERLESEVPLGAFLSGGIDSGLVVSAMAELLPQLTTVSVGFDEREHNELGAAAATAERFHTNHFSEVLQPRLDEMLPRIAAAFDEPFADSSAIPTYYVSEGARRHVTVALSGDGGDEIFGGYALRYALHVLECRVRPFIPRRLAAPAFGAIGARWPRHPGVPRPLRFGTVLENLSRDAAGAYFMDLCFLKPFETRTLLGRAPTRDPRDSQVYDRVTAPYRQCPSRSPLQRAQYADMKIYLPNDVLVKVDRMSMQHGLEVRSPLLDRRIAELAFNIPSDTKTPGLKAKYLLKKLAERRLPASILGLPKHGFTAPVAEWLRGPYAGRFRDDVLGPGSAAAGLIDLQVVRRWFDEHQRGAMNRDYALWAVWMLELWARARRERTGATSRGGAGAVARAGGGQWTN